MYVASVLTIVGIVWFIRSQRQSNPGWELLARQGPAQQGSAAGESAAPAGEASEPAPAEPSDAAPSSAESSPAESSNPSPGGTPAESSETAR